MLTALIQSAVDAIIVIDEDGTITLANPAAERLFGYDAAKLIGKNICILEPNPQHPDEKERLGARLKAGPSELPDGACRVLARRSDGSALALQLSVGEYHNAGKRYFAGFLRATDESMKHESDLRLALDDLSLALAETGLGIWECDLASDRTVWSEAVYRMFGRKPDEFTGSPEQVLSFIHPEDRHSFQEAFKAVRRGDADLLDHQFRIVRPDGEVRWLHRRAIVRRRGHRASLIGIAFDITERKQAEEANAQLAALVSSADDTISRLSTDGTILSWNAAAERMFGYTAEEIIGQSVTKLYPPHAKPEFESIYERIREGQSVRTESVRIRKDGTPLDVSIIVTPVHGPDGRVVGASAVVRDISERRRTEQRLVETLALLARESELLRTIINEIPVMITLYRPDTGITRPNRAFEQALGWSAEEMAHQAVLDHIYPDPEYRRRVQEFMQSCQPGWMDIRMRTRDGRDLETSWAYVHLSDGTQVGIGIDITERKEREAHIRMLLSEVSHRSKNLLAVVQAIAALTARGAASPVQFAATFGARLKSLAASLDLLVQRDWRGASIRQLVRSQLAHYAELIDTRVEIEGSDLLLGPVAAQYLGMALHELSTNAVKYGALSVPTGRVRIEWRLADAGSARRFFISWVERGGPPASAPRETGFGHLVIERMVGEALQGRVALDFAPEGLRWSLDAEAANVLIATHLPSEPDNALDEPEAAGKPV
jgi:PAS domain S-box-containing protein